MSDLSELVKKEFVKIYSNYNFLEVLRNNLLNDLKKHRIDIIIIFCQRKSFCMTADSTIGRSHCFIKGVRMV